MVVKRKLEKDDICKVDINEIMENLRVREIENSKRCLIEYNGVNYISKSCKPEDIIKKIRKNCGCNCGDHIKL